MDRARKRPPCGARPVVFPLVLVVLAVAGSPGPRAAEMPAAVVARSAMTAAVPAPREAYAASDSAAPATTVPGDSSIVEGMRSLAESLEQFGDYPMAAVEYQRYELALPPGDAGARWAAEFRAARCYRQARRPSVALRHLEGLAAAPVLPDSLRDAVIVERARTLGQNGGHAAALRLLAGVPVAPPFGAGGDARRLLGAAEALHLRQPQAAMEFLADTVAGSRGPLDDERRGLLPLAGTAARWKGPSPITAAALSALVPGAGRLYCGRPMEGIYSFVLHGIAAWQAVSGFRRDGTRSGRGWTGVSVGAILYGGNVYGSAVSAARVRDQRWDLLLLDVDRSVEGALGP